MDSQKKGKLYLIPTPLAENTLDKMVTAEMTEVIKSLDYFLVENVRTARRFISSLKLNIDIEGLRFEVLDKNTNLESAEKICAPLLEGKNVGIMSEAGCPGIADPGNLAVKFAHKHGLSVFPLVGPSSIFMALMASGFNGQSFAFHGYLPIEQRPRKEKIQQLEKEAYKSDQTQIFMETPYRNQQLLKDLLTSCKPFTQLCIARDISGDHQYINTKTVKEWKKINVALHKIPTVFLIHKG